jgi:hypothetical protein
MTTKSSEATAKPDPQNNTPEVMPVDPTFDWVPTRDITKSPVDPDHLAGYPQDAATHINEYGQPIWGVPVGPKFDKSFHVYEFDDPNDLPREQPHPRTASTPKAK